MDLWYNTVISMVRAYKSLFMRSVQVVGKDNIPAGPKIIVANHPNVTDSFVLPFIIRERLHFMIQADTFSLPILGRLLELADLNQPLLKELAMQAPGTFNLTT